MAPSSDIHNDIVKSTISVLPKPSEELPITGVSRVDSRPFLLGDEYVNVRTDKSTDSGFSPLPNRGVGNIPPVLAGWKDPVVPTGHGQDPVNSLLYPVISTIKDVVIPRGLNANRIPYKVATDGIQTLNIGEIPGVGAYCEKLDNFSTSKIICPVDASHPVIERHGNSCKRAVCPVCYTSWLRQAADRIGSVVMPYHNEGFSDYYPSSVVLSISPDEPYISRGKERGLLIDYLAGKEPGFQLKYLHRFFNDKLLSYGAAGGVGFVHLVRTAKGFPRFTTGLKRWQAVRSAGYAWKDAVRYSPHYHAITYGFLREPEDGEFLYKKLGMLLNRDEVEKVAYYSLDHAAIALGKKGSIMQVPSYFGVLAKGKWHALKTQKEFYDYLCVVCGSKMIDEITRKTASGSRTVKRYRGEP